MIDNKVEMFNAEQAIDVGLVDALKNGSTTVEGTYKFDSRGFLTFKQKPFTFNDKNGSLRIGKFINAEEMRKFDIIVRTQSC